MNRNQKKIILEKVMVAIQDLRIKDPEDLKICIFKDEGSPWLEAAKITFYGLPDIEKLKIKGEEKPSDFAKRLFLA